MRDQGHEVLVFLDVIDDKIINDRMVVEGFLGDYQASGEDF